MHNVTVWKFQLYVNPARPSDELYFWILCLHKCLERNSPIYEDKRIIALVNFFWGRYKLGMHLWLYFNLIPLII
jgi:hypothetical protein